MAYAGGQGQQPSFSSRDAAKDLLEDWVSNFYFYSFTLMETQKQTTTYITKINFPKVVNNSLE